MADGRILAADELVTLRERREEILRAPASRWTENWANCWKLEQREERKIHEIDAKAEAAAFVRLVHLQKRKTCEA